MDFEDRVDESGWSRLLDRYLLAVDRGAARSVRARHEVTAFLDRSSERGDLNDRLILKLTFLGILVSMLVFVVSCRSVPWDEPPPRSFPFETGEREKKEEQLFIKRERMVVRPRESGSTTGSLWADARQPRTLLAQSKPGRLGDVVTVNIPPELQFEPAAAVAGKGGAKDAAGKGKGEEGKESKKGEGKDADKDALAGARLTDPYSVGQAKALAPEKLTFMKMEVIGAEPGGDVYLRGHRNMDSDRGERRDVMILAKIPMRDLHAFDIDARSLTGLELTESSPQGNNSYAAMNWDPVITRKLSGFRPDVDLELQALDEVRGELAAAQDGIRDQQQQLAAERERLRKERDRLAPRPAAAEGGAEAPASDAQAPGKAMAKAGPAAGGKP